MDHDFIDEKIDLIGHSVYNNLDNEEENTIPDMSFEFLSYKFDYKDEPQEVKVGQDVYRSTPDANPDDTEIPAEHPFAWVNVENEEDLIFADSTYLKSGAKVYKKTTGEETREVSLPDCTLSWDTGSADSSNATADDLRFYLNNNLEYISAPPVEGGGPEIKNYIIELGDTVVEVELDGGGLPVLNLDQTYHLGVSIRKKSTPATFGETIYEDRSWRFGRTIQDPVIGDIVYNETIPGETEYVEMTVDSIEKDVTPLVTEIVFLDNGDLFLDANNEKVYIPRDNEVILDKAANVVVGDYLLSDFYNDDEGKKHSRLTRVIEVKNVYGEKPNDGKPAKKAGILVICADKVSKTRGSQNNIVIKVTPIDKVADHFQWVCLNGFQVKKEAMPDGTNTRQNEILDMIREYPEFPSTRSNLFSALIDRDYVQWRYLVDTFGLGIEEECKKVYTILCQARKSAFAIVNCPSQLDFKKSHDPWFTNKTGGVEVEFIAKGGDLSRNPSFLFTLPKIENGASWGAYYYPYLRITDLSAPKSVPPAAYVSNLYIQKYNRGFAWSIVAGQKRGVISGNQVVGVEATLVHENRDWLEPMGINAIIWEQGVGVEVYGNKTAKQNPVSALSSIHVREAAIHIQDNVESILRRYIFEFNTAQARMEIKTLVDEFLENMKNNGGLYDYRTVMDTTNNTPEVINRNQGVIDIYVEIVRGLEIIAQRLTILRTGAIAAGGFDD